MIWKATSFKLDDRFETILQFCESLSALWSAPPGEEWTLDLTGCEYLGPDAATLVFTTFLMGKQMGQHPKVLLPSSPPKVSAFCAFSGLDHYLLKGDRPNPDHPDNETIPLQQFYQTIGNQAAAITRLIRRHFVELSEDAEFYFGTAFSEVVQNIEDHAESPIGGVSCARYFSRSKHVRVAIADRGVTIAGSLGRQGPPTSDEHALRLVFVGGRTSKSKVRNLGLGIHNLSQIVTNLGGELTIYSGNGVATLESGTPSPQFRTVPIRYPGTAVFFHLNVDD
jgi:hypothetical protein